MPWLTIVCPYCRKKIPLSSIRCPECRAVIPHECGEEERAFLLKMFLWGVAAVALLLLVGLISLGVWLFG